MSVFLTNETVLYIAELDGALTSIGSHGGSLTCLAGDGATTLWGVDGYAVPAQFYTVNPATGARTSVGSTGTNDLINGLEYDAGTIYGSSYEGNLFTINPSTGAATLVGAMGQVSSGALVNDASDNNYLFLTADVAGADYLARVRKSDGNTTLIGAIGYNSVWGLAYDGGTLYGYSTIVMSLNTSTGAGTSVASMSQATYGVTPWWGATKNTMITCPRTGASWHAYNSSGTIKVQRINGKTHAVDASEDVLTGQGTKSPTLSLAPDGTLLLFLSDGTTRKMTRKPYTTGTWENY